VGIDKIDADACAARGIKIFNTPGVNASAVAELVLTLTLAVGRELGRIGRLQTQGPLVLKESCSELILRQRVIGVLGMGNIGKMVANMFHAAFDASVIVYDPYMPADAWFDIPHTRANSIEAVLRDSDIVTIHVPLTASTRHTISYEKFGNLSCPGPARRRDNPRIVSERYGETNAVIYLFSNANCVLSLCGID
jgi:phosphoglycerate dehydrogenase-like enzyme